MNDYPMELIGKGLDSRPVDERKELARLGGQSTSIKKSEGQKMRWIKKHLRKGDLTDLNCTWLLHRLESREAMAMDILIELERLRNSVAYTTLSFEQRLEFIKSYSLLLKSIHGNKINIEKKPDTLIILNINGLENYPSFEPKIKDIFISEEDEF